MAEEIIKLEPDEMLDNAIIEALTELHVKKTNDNLKAVKDLYELRISEMKVRNDYYCKAEELSNRTQELDIAKQREVANSKLINRIIAKIPDVAENLIGIGATTVASVVVTTVIKKGEQDGWMTKVPDLASKLFTPIFRRN